MGITVPTPNNPLCVLRTRAAQGDLCARQKIASAYSRVLKTCRSSFFSPTPTK